MIAVDTNVLLRRLLNDDADQAEKARRIFGSAKAVLITGIVLVEAVWTLVGKRYGARKDDIIAAVMSLLEEPNVLFENRQAVWSALNDFIDTPPVKTSSGLRGVDFADALIVNKAKATARQHGVPYQGTYTFDQAAQALNGTKQT